ncbi:MAG: hypothetical protein ACJ79H_11445 [Myxococcales bacterium]
MKSLAVALTLSLAAAGAHGQQTDTSSGTYGRSSKSKNSAGSRIGGHPTNPPEAGPSAEGRARAGYDVGVASATAGGRTDTGPVGDTRTRRRGADRDQADAEKNALRETPPGAAVDLDLDRAPVRQPPSLAQPTREEILEAQKRGRIRDREEPDWVRGPALTELETPNPFQVQLVVKNPYRHRQDDVQP